MPEESSSELMKKWGVLTPSQLKQYCRTSGHGDPLIANLIPKQSISLVVGDSGIGKTPFLYQAALCVAAGVPFLGHRTSQERVLYLDFENGFRQVNDLIERLAKYLGLAKIPETLFLWNYNNTSFNWGASDLPAMVREFKAGWTIIDSLGAYAPGIEDKPSAVTEVYQAFRSIAHGFQTAISGVHHIRKPSTTEPPPPLEEDPHSWLLQARGSRALINGSDVRIGIDRPHTVTNSECALVLGGFSRISGNIPTTFLSRALNEDDEPIGYKNLSGPDLLWNDNQKTAYYALPMSFRFKDAKTVYKREDQATSDFLKKCINLGILSKEGLGYRKLNHNVYVIGTMPCA